MPMEGGGASARRLDRDEDELLETMGGAVCALGLPAYRHALLQRRLGSMLERRHPTCSVFAVTHGVLTDENVDGTPRHAIPDVSVFCPQEIAHPKDPSVFINPTFIFEVASKGTHYRDHVEKQAFYLALESLRTYVVVEQDVRRVLVHRREAHGWETHFATRGDIDYGASLSIDELYQGVLDG